MSQWPCALHQLKTEEILRKLVKYAMTATRPAGLGNLAGHPFGVNAI